MNLFVAGLSYKTTPVAVRERVAVPPALLAQTANRLQAAANLGEVVLLSTCNRVEIYGTAPWVQGNVHRLLQELGAAGTDFTPHIYVKEGVAAVQHLLSVAGGLDSMVVGETEITGQLKNAYATAREAGLTGRVLNRLFQTALQIGKEIRTHTNIGRGAVSVGSVAVQLAEKIFDKNLTDKTLLIIGAGKMGEACLRHLAKQGAKSILVSNRSFDRAQNLAAEFGGRAVPFEACPEALVQADIVVSSTGCPQTILSRADLAPLLPARQGRPLFLIDIAVPRDIAPDVQGLANVYLYNIDHLEGLMRENLRLREAELTKCQAIIAARAQDLMARLAARPSEARQPVTAGLPELNFFPSSTPCA